MKNKINVEVFPKHLVEKLSQKEIEKFNIFFNSPKNLEIYKQIIFNKKKNIFIYVILIVFIALIVTYLTYLANNMKELPIILVLTTGFSIFCIWSFFKKLWTYQYDTEKMLPDFINLFLPNWSFVSWSDYFTELYENLLITKLINSSIEEVVYMKNSIKSNFKDNNISLEWGELKTMGRSIIGTLNAVNHPWSQYVTNNHGYFMKITFINPDFIIKNPITLLDNYNQSSNIFRNFNSIELENINDEIKNNYDSYCDNLDFFNEFMTPEIISIINKYRDNFVTISNNITNENTKTNYSPHDIYINNDHIIIKNNYMAWIFNFWFFDRSYLNHPTSIFAWLIKYYLEVKNNISLSKDLEYLFYNK
jgi:hypothetical protein